MANTWGTVMIIVNADIPPNKPRSFASEVEAATTAFAGSWIIFLPLCVQTISTSYGLGGCCRALRSSPTQHAHHKVATDCWAGNASHAPRGDHCWDAVRCHG